MGRNDIILYRLKRRGDTERMFVHCRNYSFEQIIIPQAVYSELSDESAPPPVQIWIATPPNWLKIQPVSQPSDAILDLLDPGERAAIILPQELKADLLLLDDMKARRTATARRLAITGILGILDQAATMKLIDLLTVSHHCLPLASE